VILEALNGYYTLLEADPDSGIAPPGYAFTTVSSCITLNADGDITRIISLQDDKRGKPLLVPQPPKRSGQRPEPAFLCEMPSYIFGVYKDEKGARYRFEASRKRHEEILGGVEDTGARAVLRFFEKRVMGVFPDRDADALFPNNSAVFRLTGDDLYIHERPAVRAAWEAWNGAKTDEAVIGQCLVTGEIAPIARLHGNLSGFGQDKPTLVGFNQKSFESYGKEQGQNAPVSELAAFRYVTALNELLRDRRHTIQMAGDKVVFWAERRAEREEDTLCAMLGGYDGDEFDGAESDNIKAREIKGVLSSLRSGKSPRELSLDENIRFYILGMSAAKTRLVIRFFYENSFGELIGRLLRHYRDIDIVSPPWDTKLTTPSRILRETAVGGKFDNIPPIYEGGLLRSILWETHYPYGIYMAILNRIKAETGQKSASVAINKTRVGVLKGWHNRINEEKGWLQVSLNLDEKRIGYLLGRLLAVYEKAQRDALRDVNSGVMDKYLNSALATPQQVFPVLSSLFEKHTEKSENYRNKQIVTEIMEKVPSDGFPQTLPAEEQGRFIVGYYHQRQALYTKKEDKAERDEANYNDNNNEEDEQQ
jgi:CRISPR-associated protein Csd1